MKIFITGTSSGIWEYLVENLKDNYEIIWLSRRKVNQWIKHYCWDINDYNLLDKISENEQDIDYLILNAGVWYFDKFENLSVEKHLEVLNTNLVSNIVFTSKMINKTNKWIIFIWSIAGKKSLFWWSSYAASKFWLRGFAMQLKNEYKKLNIHLINPSIIDTDFHTEEDKKTFSKFKKTSLTDVFNSVKNIIENKEYKFEIDL